MRAVNLLPPDRRPGAASASSSRLTPWHAIVGVAAVVLVVFVGLWAVARHDRASARSAETAARTRSATAQPEVDRLQPIVALDQRRRTREAAVVALASDRTDWAMVLRSIAGALPAQVGLNALGLQTAGAPTSASGSGGGTVPAGLGGVGSVTIGGCADSQPRVASTLRALRALPQVADVALNQTSRTAADTGAAAGGGGGGSVSAGDCHGVTMDAAVGLSTATVLGAAASAASTTTGASGAADATDPPAAAGTNGASR